jgi:uncharacterized protein (DUF885 family)
MNIQRRRRQTAWIVAASICAVLLGGCQIRQSGTEATTAAPYEDHTAQSYEHYEEQQLTAQEDFDELMDQVFQDELSGSQLDLHYLLKDPSVYGVEKADALYPPLTDEAMAQNRKDRDSLSKSLASFDAGLLTSDQKLTKRVLESFLNTESMADGLELYAQPLAVTVGIQAQLPILLSEYTFYKQSDIDDYLELLGGIDDYYAQIMDFEQKKSAAGLMMSDTTIDHIIESCESYLLVPDHNFMISTFDERLDQVNGLTDEEKETYRAKNTELLEQHFVPAYQLLIDGLEELKGTGTNEGGQAGFPQGKEYYEYLVYAATGTSSSSVDDLLKSMESAMDGYLQTSSALIHQHPELLDQLDTYAFSQTEPDAIIEDLKMLSQETFPALPECHYTLKDVPTALESVLSPAFYLISPMDDYQNNVIYINHNPKYSSNNLYTIIAHEGYPGHLYQNVYFHTHCDSNVRKLLSFPGYSEGWATYVEQQAYTMDNGLSPEMGQLLSANYMATLGLSACLDVYVNYLGWDKEQVREYLKNFNDDPDSVVDSVYETLVETPANYLSYYVGCMEFQNMQAIAEKKLGKKYDTKAFHTFLLDMGSAPFDVIQPYFTAWLNSQK